MRTYEMNCEGIFHKCGFNDCYALNEDELVINLHANKSVDKVLIYYEDPYLNDCAVGAPWDGIEKSMKLDLELRYENIWTITLKPKFKRLMYYFVVFSKDESRYVYENGVTKNNQYYKHYFKFGWMNDSDIFKVPKWVENTIWYQIFPERFAISGSPKSHPLLAWDDTKSIDRHCFYGGDIKGATTKLEYLKDLGVTGVYFNPIFESTENHKYNTTDYTKIDKDFGDDKDMQEFISKAHSLGIKVMIDAVFNHSGTNFFAWQDVLKHGKDSAYFDWFYINDPSNLTQKKSTKDGRYFTFAFVEEMPKLNTNNPKVVQYFLDVTKDWLTRWDLDGIRFDVGNEISHSFIKTLRRHIKAIKPDIYLLGEIWMDSSMYMMGDEYDSVMNYPFLQSVGNFFLDESTCAKDFEYWINYCYSLYNKQANKVIFNLLDSHDIDRLLTRSKSYDKFLQQLAVLFTMPGSPCIYYGTELGLEGENDPYNRLPMPWDKVNSPDALKTYQAVKALIALRKAVPSLLGTVIEWHVNSQDRTIWYTRTGDGDKAPINVVINANTTDIKIDPKVNQILYSYKYQASTLEAGGFIIYR